MVRKIKLSQEQISTIERCAGLGLTIEEISIILNVSRPTLNRKLRDEEEVRNSYETGRAKAKLKVVGKLFELIEEGNPAAIFFYLKCKCGWRETEVIQQNEHREVTIYLPAKDPEQITNGVQLPRSTN
jgi:transcriptional regulator with XRE-family HTH domain